MAHIPGQPSPDTNASKARTGTSPAFLSRAGRRIDVPAVRPIQSARDSTEPFLMDGAISFGSYSEQYVVVCYD